jgi:nitrite reductase/ring-hydroxylating ferredoxin subunit
MPAKQSLPVVSSAKAAPTIHEIYSDLYHHMPSGWYVRALSTELVRGQVKTIDLAGRELVLYRTESGKVVATEPHCPHMGAHLGHGGRVRGELIECPFHSFRFATDGRCVSTPYDAPVPRCKLGMIEVRELHGLILVWFGAAEEAPSFEVPDIETDGFSPMQMRRYRFRGHPQETNENSVDSGHFGIVHGYTNVKVLRELQADGAYLSVKYAMDRPMVPAFPKLGTFYAEFFIHVYGLGYSRVEVDLPELGVRSRHLVFATPVAPGELEIMVGFTMRSLRSGAGLSGKRRGAALGLLDDAAVAIGLDIFRRDVEQDFDIWKHKKYVHPPQLSQADGPISFFRRYCRQFYPQAAPAQLAEAAAE